jgi:hypothetical protein
VKIAGTREGRRPRGPARGERGHGGGHHVADVAVRVHHPPPGSRRGAVAVLATVIHRTTREADLLWLPVTGREGGCCCCCGGGGGENDIDRGEEGAGREMNSRWSGELAGLRAGVASCDGGGL